MSSSEPALIGRGRTAFHATPTEATTRSARKRPSSTASPTGRTRMVDISGGIGKKRSTMAETSSP